MPGRTPDILKSAAKIGGGYLATRGLAELYASDASFDRKHERKLKAEIKRVGAEYREHEAEVLKDASLRTSVLSTELKRVSSDVERTDILERFQKVVHPDEQRATLAALGRFALLEKIDGMLVDPDMFDNDYNSRAHNVQDAAERKRAQLAENNAGHIGQHVTAERVASHAQKRSEGIAHKETYKRLGIKDLPAAEAQLAEQALDMMRPRAQVSFGKITWRPKLKLSDQNRTDILNYAAEQLIVNASRELPTRRLMGKRRPSRDLALVLQHSFLSNRLYEQRTLNDKAEAAQK